MATIADQMITNGVTVLAIVNLDNASGAAIEKKAASQGVQTIDYDRLTLGGSADYYVSFDSTRSAASRARAWRSAWATSRGTSSTWTARRTTTTPRCSRTARTRSSTR